MDEGELLVDVGEEGSVLEAQRPNAVTRVQAVTTVYLVISPTEFRTTTN